MTEVLHAFEPNTSELNMYLILGLVTSIVCFALFYYSLKKHKQLLLLFSGFIGFIALGVSVFSYVNQTKLPTVQLYKNGLSTPQGTVTFDNIRKIEFKDIEEHSKFPIQKDGKLIAIDTFRLILIEEYSGKAHVLSEANYPLNDIFAELKVLVADFQKRNPPTNPE